DQKDDHHALAALGSSRPCPARRAGPAEGNASRHFGRGMNMELTGFVGWRGMVGSVLLDRMQAERDFELVEPLFFSTSDAGGKAPSVAKNETRLRDAYDVEALKRCSVIVTCQGGDYTNDVHPRLRASGWKGHWIDAA